MDDVRVQIVNYRTRAFLLECLRSLFWSLGDTSLSYSVAVLDNASDDVIADLPSLFPGQRLTVHHSETNLGFGGGHNLLAARGEARYLLLLNPDTRMVERETLPSLLRTAIEMRAQVVGPRLVTGKGTTQKWDHGELDGWIARLCLGTGNSYWRERQHVAPAAWVSGAAFLVDKRWFDDMGGFDEQFFLYKEEEELCWRIRARGGTTIYDPTLSVFHHVGVVARKADHLRKSTDYFLYKHFRNRIDYPMLRLLNRLFH